MDELTAAEVAAIMADNDCLDEGLREWLTEDALLYREIVAKVSEAEERELDELKARIAALQDAQGGEANAS